MCQVLSHLKSHNKFYEDISIQESLTSDEILRFLETEHDEEKPEIPFWRSNPDEHAQIASNENSLIAELKKSQQ